jgi:hypothetical protein
MKTGLEEGLKIYLILGRWDSRAQVESTAAEGIAFSDMVQHFIEEVKVL